VVALVATIVFSIISFGNATVFGWLAVLLNLALLWPSYNLGMKRRHDRDSDGTDLKILLGASILLNLLTATGIGITWTDIGGGVMVPQAAFWLTALNLIFGVFAIYMLVQLGFLKGTTGSNTFGSDPVGAAA
jgi:uncharacterized membrane protein YhaH (DUF805 family)